MTSVTGDAAAFRQKGATQGAPPLWLTVAGALVVGFVLSLPRFLAVWQTGAFFDSDDATRLVEVRNLLAGQNWFDLTLGRLDPPNGVFMHWSRVVDLPLAGLIKMFALALPLELAERAARLTFSLILQGLLYVGVARLAALLMSRAAVVPAVLLAVLSGAVFSQFQPGRIDHHAPQIVLVLFMTAATVAACERGRAWQAAVAGALAALSLSISIETLPFIVVLAAVLVLGWVVWGDAIGATLLPFGTGLGLGLIATFFATIGPSHWRDTSCDAYSFAYFAPGLVGALVSIALGLAARRLKMIAWRLVAALAGAAAVGLAFAAVRPICLIDPFTGMDPLLRTVWLDHVTEAMTMRRFLQRDAAAAVSLFSPILLGVACCGLALRHERGVAQRRWLIVFAMGLTGAALSLWMIRVISFASPLTLLGGVWCIVNVSTRIMQTRRAKAAAVSLLLVVPFSAIGWALFLPDDHRASESDSSCLTPAAVQSLQRLKPGLIAAPINAGSYILAFTSHSVLAAPYHRNNDGNRAMIDILLAEPTAAAAMLHDRGVDYIALCSDLGETATLAARAPDGLAAALRNDKIPNFLEPVLQDGAKPNEMFRIFKVKP